MAKRERQAAILDLLREQRVETQEQLAQELHRRQIEADQATISRDLQQLGVARVTGSGGRRYLPPAKPSDPRQRAAQIIRSELETLERVGLMVVVHTPVGAAQVVAAAVDSLGLAGVAGTVAGDDTIFIQARSTAGARRVVQLLDNIRRTPDSIWGGSTGSSNGEVLNGE
ncbi:MAG TPA: arginine repressor [Candidatus Dormibacteraeota bacterium]|nr:arginine repressor [Candidatus Dormibacteraeota bacterium]